jgi:acyl dehydratase
MALTLTNLADHMNLEIGVSDWMTIDQARIDRFAECTGDFQWIHIDAVRAKDGPFGATVAHGFLTLSLIPQMQAGIWANPSGIAMAFNYGLNRVRFAAPVKCGNRVRDRITLTQMEDKGGGRLLLTMEHVIEIEGQDKPALVATSLTMVMGG